MLRPINLSPYERTVTLLRTIIASSGVGISGVACFVLMLYALEVARTGNWSVLLRTEMAPGTAFLFLLTGVALIALGLLLGVRRRNNDGCS